jgi:hypothetical protein
MKVTIQKNETTILAASNGYVVATLTAGTGLSHNLRSYDGQRRSDLLVHNKVFKTFRDPRLAKLYFNILDAGEVKTDFWRKPQQESGDWFLLEQYHTGKAKKFWDGVFPEEDGDPPAEPKAGSREDQYEDCDTNPDEPVVSEYEKVSYDHDDFWN